MKHIFPILLFTLTTLISPAQKDFVDSLHHQLRYSKEDTTRVLLLSELGNYYAFNQFDSGVFYGRKTVDLSNKLHYPNGIYLGLKCLFFSYNCQGNYPKALEVTLQNLKNAEKIRNETPIAFMSAIYCLGLLNREMGNFQIAIEQLETSAAVYVNAGLPEPGMYPVFCQLALVYQRLGRLDSALWFAQKGYELSLKPNIWSRFICFSASVLGFIHTAAGNYEQAKTYLFIGSKEAKRVNNIFFLSWNYNLLANLFKQTNVPDSCIYYARISLSLWRAHNFGDFAVSASTLLTSVFETQNKPDSVIKYMKIMLAAKDTVFSQTKVKEFEKFVFDEEKRKQDMLQAQELYKNKVKVYVLLAVMAAVLLIAFILWQNNRQKQRAKKEIEEAYEELKSTQAQLVQREKMASLGELTAGIAHEIQNPLNFVNNFSEVNNELIVEMKQEIDKGNYDEVKLIANDIEDNGQKINHHGKRADAIVKGMLQHSQPSTGKREPTDINKVADEYLRLAYHGLRSKDNSFNAEIQTDFDEKIGNINIVPQDIGRVLLNLFNNAFYAVSAKALASADSGYKPTISVSTKKNNGKVEIRVGTDGGRSVQIKVADNGGGIPKNIVDKIFQPFFTTKPTGQGTGLGLSLAYDIVKAHGGEIKVETKEGEGSVFLIQLAS